MNTAAYEIGVTIPVQVGKGKMEKGKDHTEATTEAAKIRNEKYDFIGVKTLKNSEKELRAYLAKYAPEKLKEFEDKKVEKEGFEVGE